MAISLFTRRAMDESLKQMKTPKTFLLNRFFNRVKLFDTKVVDIDTFDGKRRKAAYVHRRANSQQVEAQGFTSEPFEAPYINEIGVTEAEEQFNRNAGNPAYGGQDASQVAADQMSFDISQIEDTIVRAEEFQAMQAIFESKVEVHDSEDDEIRADIVFQRKATHAIAVPASGFWTSGTSDPHADIRGFRRLTVKNAGVSVTDLVFGELAIDVFLANAAVREILDNRRMNFGNLEAVAEELGVNFYGTIEGGIRIWSYEEFFQNTAGTEVPLIPTKKVAAIAASADLRRHYGAVKSPEGILVPARRMIDTWVTKEDKDRVIQIQSRPLCVPVQNNGIVVAQVIAP